MGRMIDPAQARVEARNYLSLALALLDEAGAFRAALHTATALDHIEIPEVKTATGLPDGAVEQDEFAISWGILVSADTLDSPAVPGDVTHHEP